MLYGAHGVEFVTRKNFYQIVLYLNMLEINYSGIDSQNLDQHWLLSHMNLPTSLPPTDDYSASHGSCRDHSTFGDQRHLMGSLPQHCPHCLL